MVALCNLCLCDELMDLVCFCSFRSIIVFLNTYNVQLLLFYAMIRPSDRFLHKGYQTYIQWNVGPVD